MKLELTEMTVEGLMKELVISTKRRSKYRKLSDGEIARLLVGQVWSNIELLSVKSDLVNEAALRLAQMHEEKTGQSVFDAEASDADGES